MRVNTVPPKAATILTVLTVLLVPLATLVGLLVPGFYRDTAWMTPQARGQDLITLVVAEPLLLVGLLAAWRGHFNAGLLWMGALSYLLYTYAMYSYTAYFNSLFLVYVALFSATLFALIDLLVHVDLATLRAAVRPTASTRALRASAGFLALTGFLFLVAWLGQIVPALLNGTVPDAVVLAKTPTSAVHVQDLAVVIPLLFVAAIWLWRRQIWGVVLGAILLVLANVMLTAILAMGLFSAQAGIAGALDMSPVFAALTGLSLGVTALFFAQLQRPVALKPDTLLSSGAGGSESTAEAASRDDEDRPSLVPPRSGTFATR